MKRIVDGLVLQLVNETISVFKFLENQYKFIMKDIESPCIKVCQHDSEGVCFGCRRTRHEVGNWYKYTNEEKAEVIKKTSARRNVRGESPVGFLR